VCKYYRVDAKALRGKTRGKEIVGPRQVAMYLLREDLDLALTEIGRELGGRDHSTVMHGCDKVATDIEADAQLRKDVGTIRENLYNAAKG
jgi:chromosomal replication initiator protein